MELIATTNTAHATITLSRQYGGGDTFEYYVRVETHYLTSQWPFRQSDGIIALPNHTGIVDALYFYRQAVDLWALPR